LPYLRRLSPPSSASAKRAAYSPAGLVQGTNGDFYGTTAYGGNGGGCPFPNIGCGRLFKITPGGAPTTLYSFCSQIGCPDGEYPYAGLIQATNGEFYGTTVSGGNAGEGSSTIVKISPNGTLTTLYTFDGTQGIYPDAGLIQATNGDFYGTTQEGGTYDVGTIFSLSVGLGPFVETQTASGKVGAAVKILGNNLTHATSVGFNGASAVFTVVSSSEITTTVPTGAATGTVQVVTPNGTLSSNVPFRVP
jgi:uncharacterized repeat protein (TIGR03803 family)